ncbi:DNA-directed RNA polymerases II, IV and V subunit 8B-like isoform X2 [Diospyros lotus]|uniref:DNA-directed RNA polymerases II, IV and V subunit 8B-like isoform X2 n=1 Tax=Diospyros lotus TaxID=55363 RepID=UPI00225C32B6|nr:DNA-directed RNA polymerases II, IV and V subunit 8B-like isoform X2 [Diospyros lotus]
MVKNMTKINASSVSRIEARSEEYGMEMQLDVHTEIYPVHVGEKYRMALAPSLNLDGTAVTSYFPEGGSKSLADKFEYVMHGLLYKMSEDASGSNAKVVVYMSFGGLQLMLKGDPVNMGNFKLDQRLFLLMRKM